jgi:peroxiredoxin
MGDMGVGCQVADLVSGGPAKEAGVRPLDLIIAIDGVPLASQPATIGPCNVLIAQITSHAPGDTIKLDIRRGFDPVAIKVTLSTRAEVLHRRLVGHSLGSVALSDADDPRRSYDVASGQVTVLGWFHADSCSGCSLVFDKVHDQLRERLHGEDVPDVIAVTPDAKPEQGKSAAKKSFTASVPLAFAPEGALLDGELLESDRVLFVIVDGHGVVRFVAPIAPESDDADAALDEVLAAAEQLSRR